MHAATRALDADRAQERRFWKLGREVRVSAPRSSALALALDEVYGRFAEGRLPAAPWAEAPLRPATTVALDVAPGPGGLRLTLDGVPVLRCDGAEALAPIVEGALLGLTVRARAGEATFHAAAVSARGAGILILGGKGSGKSTLALQLDRLGAVYFGDELALIRYGDGHLAPFPKAAALKHGASPLFPEAGPPHPDPIRGPIRYLLPAAAAAPEAAGVPIARVVLPAWDTSARLEVEALCPEELGLALVQECFGGLERDRRTLGLIERLSTVPGRLVGYADGAAAAAAILAELEGRS